MNRAKLDPSAGMIFVFAGESQQTFWMKNTLIPLDMIFIAADRHIVGIVENAEPLTLTPRRVAGRSQYVLEVNGGFSAAHHIQAGSLVRIENLGEGGE
jgi:uncharacterized membrane protein (UPF0127 family)